MDNFNKLEKMQNIILPKEYKFLDLDKYNKIVINIEGLSIILEKFLDINEIVELINEFYDIMGYDIIPIAKTNFCNDYICLYYKNKFEDPLIIYWDYELAFEFDEDAIIILYKNMKELVSILNKTFI